MGSGVEGREDVLASVVATTVLANPPGGDVDGGDGVDGRGYEFSGDDRREYDALSTDDEALYDGHLSGDCQDVHDVRGVGYADYSLFRGGEGDE